jgi:hypothetical protein
VVFVFELLSLPSVFLLELFLISFNVVPERYEIKAGRIGKIHGEKNDAAPARAETRTFASTT